MDLVQALPAFFIAVVLISASPGPAVVLIVRRAAVYGARAAVPVVLGLELGLYVWAVLAGAGLAAVVAASQVAYTVLRFGGGAFLVVLGVLAWRSALRGGSDVAALGETAPVGRRSWWGGFAEGVVTQLANPKAAVFMFAFYPQFVPAGRPLLATTMMLAVLQVALETMLYLSLAAGVGRAGAWFSRDKVRRRFEAASGTILIGLGPRVAIDPR